MLDDSEGSLGLGAPELSIYRRLDRTGEGEYRLAGARCRLIDVVELLSDTGLGKEMHSVISQGRVESIVTSKPRDRRLLIEEAAGLGKHRKRRRRAQLKLTRTQDNLDRALDVEREARSRLRPLKRQAEAAELHARLERQALEIALGAGARRAARGSPAVGAGPARRDRGAGPATADSERELADGRQPARGGRGGARRPQRHARGALAPGVRGAGGGASGSPYRAETIRSASATVQARLGRADELATVAAQDRRRRAARHGGRSGADRRARAGLCRARPRSRGGAGARRSSSCSAT